MLEIRELSIKVNLKYLIRNLSFTLNTGDKLAIIGEEGNGKSTLLKSITGDCDYAEISGYIDTKNNNVGYLKQFFDEKELLLKVFDYLFDDEEQYYEKIKIFYKYLIDLNIEERIMDLQICKLSGGEKIKVSILKLLLSDSDILLLDEPSNDLDIDSLHWLEDFINRTEKPIIYISHDETLLSKTANMILHLELVKHKQECKHAVIKDNYDNYINMRLNKLDKQTQQAKFEQNKLNSQIQRLNQIKQKVDYKLNTISRSDPHGARLLKKKMKSIKSQEKRINNQDITQIPEYEEKINLFFEEAEIPSKKEIINISLPCLKVENNILAHDIHLKVSGNKHIVIIGKNGTGKTTFMKFIYDTLKSRKDIKIGYMPQFYNDVFKEYEKPLEFLCPDGDKITIAKVRSYLGNLNITTEEMLKKIEYLSGGTKAKLFLLKMVIDKCNVLLLDEPTRNLSPLSNPVIRKILANFTGTIISISHDRKYINEVCEVVYELNESGLVEIFDTIN